MAPRKKAIPAVQPEVTPEVTGTTVASTFAAEIEAELQAAETRPGTEIAVSADPTPVAASSSAVVPAVSFENRINQYVKLRDMLKEKDKAHKEAMAPIREAMEGLEALMLNHLNAVGGNSVATNAGTVYRTEKASASLADGDAFMRYVIGSAAWDLLDRKANVTAVRDFIAANSAPPPGVNFSIRQEVGVRRK